jgi:hypothetical protein
VDEGLHFFLFKLSWGLVEVLELVTIRFFCWGTGAPRRGFRAVLSTEDEVDV